MTHRIQFLRRHQLDINKSYGLSALAKVSGVRRSHLQKVYNRGVGAWKTNIRSVRMKGTFKKNVDAPRSAKLTKEQWGMSRCYAFLNKLDRIKEGKQKTLRHDCDIALDYIKSFECQMGGTKKYKK
jgi:hypothetical protein